MAHKYMSYSRDAAGLITRTHRTVVLSDIADYHHKEHLSGWPEKCVFWMIFADGSAEGIAPMSDLVEKKITIDTIKTATGEQLDEIVERTEYADVGVALGGAAADQDLRRAAMREIERRIYGD